ncbi:uncharacterized protein KD926_002567 [Aspergillus affinis]|uniref:uncharacterized protein n=1 Tax=Aspergillus affinis TaxID=1070780 RepID=UPI0022FE2DC8|nr:uncharacterized protein KD926_002567 [Aspergillus affinis]KAI9035955.1 hypothetical protein KD926_002567 [Aspergillus affinis]
MTNQHALRSRILVTGANGYIASHVVDQLLGLGYMVRGTIRGSKPWLNQYFDQKYGSGCFETVIVPSFEDMGVIESALDGIDPSFTCLIIRNQRQASDLTFGCDPNAVIPWVVQATLSILEIASRKPSIKRVVLVSSSSATYPLTPDPAGRQLHSDIWNDAAVRAAWDDNTPLSERAVAVYAASKTEGERQSWKWVESHRPHFEFNTVLPCFVVGKILHPEILGSTMGSVRELLQGDSTAFSKFPGQWYVDVEDTARLCALGLLDDTVKSERIFAF